MSVRLRDPETGETKVLPDGWCWSCFLFGGFFGMPLYRRGLQVWGSLMVAFNVVVLVVSLAPTERADTLYGWLLLIGMGLSGFFGLRANRMAIDRHLALGWQPIDRNPSRLAV